MSKYIQISNKKVEAKKWGKITIEQLIKSLQEEKKGGLKGLKYNGTLIGDSSQNSIIYSTESQWYGKQMSKYRKIALINSSVENVVEALYEGWTGQQTQVTIETPGNLSVVIKGALIVDPRKGKIGLPVTKGGYFTLWTRQAQKGQSMGRNWMITMKDGTTVQFSKG